jgi:hypothetical protein
MTRSGVRHPLLAAMLTALLAGAVTLLAPAQPALADGPVRAILDWIKCGDESESFSDEPFVERDGGSIHSWQNVDGDWQPHYFLVNREQWFDADYLYLHLREDDGQWSEDDNLGWFVIPRSHVDTGDHLAVVSGPGYYYELRYFVFSS